MKVFEWKYFDLAKLLKIYFNVLIKMSLVLFIYYYSCYSYFKLALVFI